MTPQDPLAVAESLDLVPKIELSRHNNAALLKENDVVLCLRATNLHFQIKKKKKKNCPEPLIIDRGKILTKNCPDWWI